MHIPKAEQRPLRLEKRLPSKRPRRYLRNSSGICNAQGVKDDVAFERRQVAVGLKAIIVAAIVGELVPCTYMRPAALYEMIKRPTRMCQHVSEI